MSVGDGLPSDDWRVVGSSTTDDGIEVISDESERDSSSEEDRKEEQRSSQAICRANLEEWTNYLSSFGEHFNSQDRQIQLIRLVAASIFVVFFAVAMSQWNRPTDNESSDPDEEKVSSSLLTLQRLELALGGLDKSVQQMNERLAGLSDDVQFLKKLGEHADAQKVDGAEDTEEPPLATQRSATESGDIETALTMIKQTVRSVQKQVYIQIITSSYEHKLRLYRRLLSSGFALEWGRNGESSRGDFLLTRSLRNLISKSSSLDFDSWLDFYANVLSPQMQDVASKLDSLTSSGGETSPETVQKVGKSDEFFVRTNLGEADSNASNFVTPDWKDVVHERKPRRWGRYEARRGRESQGREKETRPREVYDARESFSKTVNSEPQNVNLDSNPIDGENRPLPPTISQHTDRNDKHESNDRRHRRNCFLDDVSKYAQKTVSGVRATFRNGLTKMKKWTKSWKNKEAEKRSYASWRNEFVGELMDLVRTVGRNPTLQTVSSYLGEGLEKLTSPVEGKEY